MREDQQQQIKKKNKCKEKSARRNENELKGTVPTRAKERAACKTTKKKKREVKILYVHE